MTAERERPVDGPTDEMLVQAVGSGQTEALHTLVQRHQDKARRFARHMLRDGDAADDVAQDVFLRVHAAAHKYQSRGRFNSWFYRIATNLCLDHLRRAKRRPARLTVAVADPSAPEASDTLARSETIQRVRKAVDELPERQRVVVILHRYQGLSHEDISATTGWSRSAVESLLVRAYAHLRETLADLL